MVVCGFGMVGEIAIGIAVHILMGIILKRLADGLGLKSMVKSRVSLARNGVRKNVLLIPMARGRLFEDNFHKISRFPRIRRTGILCRRELIL